MSCRRHTPAKLSIFCLGLTALMFMAPVTSTPAAAQARSFPFDHELRFDADPVRGSRRVPGLLISSNGEVEIDLWCVSGTGRAVIADSNITIVPTGMRDNQCPPDRLLMDKQLLDQLMQVTSWRWEGQLLVLVGPQSLRYRPTSN